MSSLYILTQEFYHIADLQNSLGGLHKWFYNYSSQQSDFTSGLHLPSLQTLDSVEKVIIEFHNPVVVMLNLCGTQVGVQFTEI